MWIYAFGLLLSLQRLTAAGAIEAAYMARGMDVQIDKSMLRASAPFNGTGHVLDVRWDAIHRESLIKLSSGKSVVLLSTPQKLPMLPASGSARPSSQERIRAGSKCTIVTDSGALSLHLDGIALRTAPIGGETRARVPALENRILKVRVSDVHTVVVLP